MKRIAVAAAVLVFGCAANAPAPVPDPRSERLNQQQEQIAQRARRCIDDAVKRADDELTGVTATSGHPLPSRIQAVKDREHQEISMCKAAEDRAIEGLASQQRADYERRAQEERDRSSLMLILTGSRGGP